MRYKTEKNGSYAAVFEFQPSELVDLIRSAIPRDAAIELVGQYVRVIAATASLDATRESYARVDKVLERKPAP